MRDIELQGGSYDFSEKLTFRMCVSLAIVGMLSACQSEVDKCVLTNMAAWHVQISENKKYNEIASQHNQAAAECEKKNPVQKSRTQDKFFEPIFIERRCVTMHHRPVDERPPQVVEAEYRNYCMSLQR